MNSPIIIPATSLPSNFNPSSETIKTIASLIAQERDTNPIVSVTSLLELTREPKEHLFQSWNRPIDEMEYNRFLDEAMDLNKYQEGKSLSAVHSFASSKSKNNNEDYIKMRIRMKYSQDAKLSGFDDMGVNAQTDSMDTPLHFSAWGNRYEKVLFFLLQGADPNVQNHKGDTPLHHALKNGKTEHFIGKTSAVILSAFGANWQTPNKIGVRPADLFMDNISVSAQNNGTWPIPELELFKKEWEELLPILMGFNMNYQRSIKPLEKVIMRDGTTALQSITKEYLDKRIQANTDKVFNTPRL